MSAGQSSPPSARPLPSPRPCARADHDGAWDASCPRARSGELLDAEYATTPIFRLAVPTKCTGVPADVLAPETQWKDRGQFYETLQRLARLFMQNFNMFMDGDRCGRGQWAGAAGEGRSVRGAT